MEENCIGSQSPQRTVVLEKKKMQQKKTDLEARKQENRDAKKITSLSNWKESLCCSGYKIE
jgi:hypothetical protein